jgi:small subunit ribosomal protein S8
MRYADGRERVIQHIERVSKPGRRIYVGKNDIQRVLGGLGWRFFPRRVVC